MIMNIDHIGIAVNSIDEAVKLYTDILGLKLSGTETMDEPKLKIAFIPVGESKIELLESTSPEGMIAKFIEKHGEGLHHMALRVSDIQSALQMLKKKGVKLLDETPRKGGENNLIAFVHPEGAKILLELVEEK